MNTIMEAEKHPGPLVFIKLQMINSPHKKLD